MGYSVSEMRDQIIMTVKFSILSSVVHCLANVMRIKSNTISI